MGCTCAPALLTARNELNLVWPVRDKSSDGCCGDAAHAARKSDHNAKASGPSKGLATAYDYDEDVVEGMGDSELQGMALILLADPRTKYLIYEGQLLYPGGTVKTYTGPNAHRHHLHHSIHDASARDTRLWGIARAFETPTPAPQEEIDMLVIEAPTNQYNYLLHAGRLVLIEKQPLPTGVPVWSPDGETWGNLIEAYGDAVGD